MGTATSKTAKNKGKFAQLLKRGGDAIIGDRADRIVRSAKASQRALVDKIQLELDGLHDKRELMLDQSPDNRYSLKVGTAFNAEDWAKEYHKLSVEIVNKSVELKVAGENFTELFGEASE